MKITIVRVVALVIFLFIGAVPYTAADTGGYTVTPGADSVLTGPPQDPVPISFWDLQPRAMLLALVLSFCPVLVFPVEIFFYLKLISLLGYRKFEQYAVTYNEKRQTIYETITENPGIRFNAIKRLTGMKNGTLKYHLLVLGMKRRIIFFGTGRYIRYFENNGRYSDLDKKIFQHLADPTARRILEILATTPEVSRKELSVIVGITGPSISWHTRRLSGDGIISIRKNGNGVRYELSPAGVNIFERYFRLDAVKGPGAPTGDANRHSD